MCVPKRGDIKIFDFGLVAELRDEYRDPFGLHHLTGMTGSPRYMAPGTFLRPWILPASVKPVAFLTCGFVDSPPYILLQRSQTDKITMKVVIRTHLV